ncbi:tetratricopeptide repeat protein [Marinicella sp. S1101]|uniref:tetratricopeptide repeat protein n=1 Tax=Marinicella marina TaxID=2996016 RepID=UPI002260DAE8|nr:tetratricopeptide repeat protein [Marinicella marina]MCX7552726.1 tetratricopeptide repeat protein [Marinicella marina]MDJ1139965.1 tetratricopeptide repeat protein [Marinicella marina]
MSELENIKKLHADGQFEQAIDGYLDILKTEPNSDEAHFGLAHASSRLNQLEVALKHAEEAVKLSPKTDRYLQFKGQMLLANNRIDEALKAFKASVKENPNLFYSYLAIGDIYAIKNESNKAKENYNFALKVHTDGLPAMVKLARLLTIESDYIAAENLLNQAELQFQNNPDLILQMGITRLELGQEGFAELYFKKLLEDEPENQVAKAYLGIALLNSNTAEAMKIITEMVHQQIKIPELMLALGMMYVKTNNYNEAIKYLTHMCQSGLAYPSWLMALAHALVGNGQPNSAQAALQQVLERGNNSRALLMLGQIHQVNKNYAKAIKTYQEVNFESEDYLQAIILQADCLYSDHKYEQVISYLEPVFKEQANHNTAIKLKLNALSQLNRIDEALAVISEIDQEKQTSQFNQLMALYAGLLLDAKQQYDEAWQHFNLIESDKPKLVNLLTSAEEKQVQAFASESAESSFKFVFTDPATGHHDFTNWLLENNITPLIDRFKGALRKDVFGEHWTVEKLAELDQAKIHFLRKKYVKQMNLVIDKDTASVADFIPFSPINLAIIKRIFPKAQVLVLNRNFADMRLHQKVFSSYQVHYSQFSKVINQMVAMNPNLSVVDVDAWQQGESIAVENIEKVFGKSLKPFAIKASTPLDQLMFPYMHWKHYQQHLNQ